MIMLLRRPLPEQPALNASEPPTQTTPKKETKNLRLLFVLDVLFVEGGVGSRSRENLPASYLRPNRLVHGSREQSIHLLESNT